MKLQCVSMLYCIGHVLVGIVTSVILGDPDNRHIQSFLSMRTCWLSHIKITHWENQRVVFNAPNGHAVYLSPKLVLIEDYSKYVCKTRWCFPTCGVEKHHTCSLFKQCNAVDPPWFVGSTIKIHQFLQFRCIYDKIADHVCGFLWLEHCVYFSSVKNHSSYL